MANNFRDLLMEMSEEDLKQTPPVEPIAGGLVYHQFVKPAALPTALSYAGAALGGGVGTPFGLTVPGAVAGGAVGSMAGEGLNQALGITEPSLSQIGLAGAVPAAIGGIGTGFRAARPFLSSGRAAQTLNALAPEEAAGHLRRLSPIVPAKVLFAQATQERVAVPMNRTLRTIDTMLGDLTDVSKGVQSANRQVISYLKGLQSKLATSPEGLPPLALQRELEGAGNVVKSVRSRGGTGSGAIKKTFDAMVNDLDDAAKLANPAQQGASALISARDAFKRESVLNEIGEAITEATKTIRGQGGQVQFNANAVLKEISKNRFYEQALTAKERTEVEGLLKLLNKIPALRPGAGQQFGSGRVQEMLRLSAIGGGAGAYAGGAPGGAMGAAAGALAQPVMEFGRNFGLALQMTTGRALLKGLLTESKGVVTPQMASIVAAYVTAVEANPSLGQ